MGDRGSLLLLLLLLLLEDRGQNYAWWLPPIVAGGHLLYGEARELKAQSLQYWTWEYLWSFCRQLKWKVKYWIEALDKSSGFNIDFFFHRQSSARVRNYCDNLHQKRNHWKLLLKWPWSSGSQFPFTEISIEKRRGQNLHNVHTWRWTATVHLPSCRPWPHMSKPSSSGNQSTWVWSLWKWPGRPTARRPHGFFPITMANNWHTASLRNVWPPV